jgi:fibronectin type 3 domain-containing protein
MTVRKYVMISAVLLCVSGLLLGCSNDDPITLAPVPVDEAPPTAVSGLNAMVTTGGSVALSWNVSSSPNLRGYKVYRHNVSDQVIGLLTASPVTDARYVDSSIEQGATYEYRVTAVSVKGLESAYATITVDTDVSNRNSRGTGLKR